MILYGNLERSKETLTQISLRYPKDKAIGYSENQIRGIWVTEKLKKTY